MIALCPYVDLMRDEEAIPPEITDVAIDEAMAHLPGVGRVDRAADDGAGAAQYVLGDQIGTLLRLFSEGGATLDMPVYTAFGEPVGMGGAAANTRYGYAGAWGYGAGAWDGDPACQTWEGDQPAPGGDTWGDCASPLGTPCCDPIAELGWLHVGERYYDPAAGRFVQRDPIGIRGGLNVYAYVLNRPTLRVDPNGLTPPGERVGHAVGGGLGAGIGAAIGVVICAGFTIATGGTGGIIIIAISTGAGGAVGYDVGGDVGDSLSDSRKDWLEEYGDPSDPTNFIHGPDRPGTGPWW